ncbi:MAG: LacI family DNA-binding transcriptional regulator [Phycisphaeraceae bacterium]|nr:LacI family DNA-binding transcriptional regulator [Phycisphaeraceae bacterium]
MTLKTIAREVGVSIATVSAVLNGKARERRITRETESRIQIAIRQLNYKPNFFATQLKQTASKLLVLCMQNIRDMHSSITGESFAKQAEKRGYHVLLSTSLSHERDGAGLHDPTLSQTDIPGGVTGMAVVSHAAQEIPLQRLQAWLKRGIEVVAVEHRFDDPRVSHVLTNEFHGGYVACKHICEQGARNIWILAGHQRPPFSYTVGGYLAAAQEAGVSQPQVLWSEQNAPWADAGYQAIKRALADGRPRPDGLLGVGGRLVMAGIHALVEHGLMPRQDFLVVSYHSGDLGLYFNPPLSTVDPPTEDAGRAAADLLIDTIEGKRLRGQTLYFEPELTIRDSSNQRLGS